MKMKGFDFLLWTQMTAERAMFAFMLQLSFYQNISTTLCLLSSIHQRSKCFRVIEWGFPSSTKQHGFLSTKPQHEQGKKGAREQGKSSCKINQWDFSSSNELSCLQHDVPWWIKYLRWAPREKCFLIERYKNVNKEHKATYLLKYSRHSRGWKYKNKLLEPHAPPDNKTLINSRCHHNA